jgi:hypothetical protein
VEAHGGRIWGENNSNGKGATFGFVIPIKSTVDYAQLIENHVTGLNTNSELFALAKKAFDGE